MDLILAAANGDTSKIQTLISQGADPNQGDYDFRRPVHLSASGGHLESTKYLVEVAKVDVNVLDRWNGTALADAMRYKFYDVASYLRSKGGIITGGDSADSSLCTELTKAVADNQRDKVNSLLSQGVDVNFGDADGRTALHFAAGQGNVEVVELLLNHGAQAHLADRWGQTPLNEAQNKKHQAVVDLLQKTGAVLADVEPFLSSYKFISVVTKTINLLTEKDRWSYATVYTLAADKKHLASVAWTGTTDSLAKLSTHRLAVEAADIPIDEDNSITKVWKTKAAISFEDAQLDKEPKALRPVIEALGFKGAFFAPVVYNNSILAILEFRSFETKKVTVDGERASASIASRMISGSFDNKSAIGVQFADQLNAVFRLILQDGIFSAAVIRKEVDWFYNGLGFNDFYFQHHSPEQIAMHVRAFIAAKLHAQTTGQAESVEFSSEDSNGAVFIAPASRAAEIERKIEARYFGEGYSTSSGEKSPLPAGHGASLRVFLSNGTASPGSSVKLSIYILTSHAYIEPKPVNTNDIWKVATGSFLREKAVASRNRYSKTLNLAASTLAPIIDVEKAKIDSEDVILTVAYRSGSTHSYFSTISQVLARFGIETIRKYVESFSNGVTVYSLHLKGISVDNSASLVANLNLLWVLPRTPLSPLFESGKLTIPEVVYSYCLRTFAFHFMASKSDEFSAVWDAVRDSDARARLLKLKKRMRSDIATEPRIAETIIEHPEMIKELFADFKKSLAPREDGSEPPKPSWNQDLWTKVNKNVLNSVDVEVFRAFLTFNANLLKTNFFSAKKVAISFRFNPVFLKDEVPVVPFGLFMMVGAEFRGLHIRFDDVARGGIRMIRSRNQQQWQRNAETAFDENYNLAYTQQKKNKDLVESGSKGVVLLAADRQDKATPAFYKYIDSMLDVMLTSKEVVDHYGKPEYIFCGPDEGTADLMDWAATHAKSRGYVYWSAYTTGKSPSLGGIPHDLYGMTTRGVHQYVLGILDKLGLKEEQVTKMSTGGPDGDLGSNEIKISKDITIGVVDGSGVLYDPNGINRTELTRLAEARIMSQNFNKALLSKDGFFISVDDKDFKLPNGELVESGLNFRNNFHIHPLARADLFVPCGGRPEAVNISNVSSLIVDGKPIFKYIVEGANLFFTQEARGKLEDVGVILFKDASANKGGVTSSSLEVLAALCLNQKEYAEHMCVTNGIVPEFYNSYVKDVQVRIEENARQEFECLWREHERTGTKRSILTDILSERIIQLNHQIRASGLWKNDALRLKVLAEVLPATLQKLIPPAEVIKRLPESYTIALLSAWLAAKYVYEQGITPNEFTFYQFMTRYSTASQ